MVRALLKASQIDFRLNRVASRTDEEKRQACIERGEANQESEISGHSRLRDRSYGKPIE